SGRFNNMMRVSPDQVRQAGLVRGAMPLAPTAGSLHFSDRGVTNIPRTSSNQRFFTHQQPNPAPRVPFAQHTMEGARGGFQPSGGQTSGAQPFGGGQRFGGGSNRPAGRGA